MGTCGLTRVEVKRIREAVSEVMIDYNFKSMLWGWIYLGLYDLLNGYSGVLAGEKHKLFKEVFVNLYNEAMSIANKGILMD